MIDRKRMPEMACDRPLAECSADTTCLTADLGQYMASSMSRPTAPVDAVPRTMCDPRGVQLACSRLQTKHIHVHTVLHQACGVSYHFNTLLQTL